MAKANKKLEALHIALIDYLLARLDSCHSEGPDGEPIFIPLPAAELGVMAKLLKDNGVVADKDHADDLEKLQARLAEERDAASRDDILRSAIESIADESGIMH